MTDIKTKRSPGRPREFDPDQMLDAALKVFSERGYQAAAISDLVEATGLTAGSLYKAYGDKRGLFLAAFDRYWSERNRMIMARISGLKTGRDKLRGILDHYADHSFGEEGRRGCLVVGGANDLSLLDADAGAHIAKTFEANRDRLKRMILLGQEDGSIRQDIDAETMSMTLLCLTMGMRVVGKTDPGHAAMLAVVDTAMTLLN
ncbi:TetR/AcrR family transcriptional regulator [Allorhizobium sp. BGMRC 0089]|uniref:TetR/AcrR family transcriptional regulator n=1 Tax=Allorhizobium sonneratiae TaxID=2934936 RepID=UPI0020337598|nr:TetR/AcrR family transcriptional regulator [Allorhizobium sonneratiae]MCM2292790.1 TetR/AcrR family transcriptional regulator [Allorhizobium sonneratiae]